MVEGNDNAETQPVEGNDTTTEVGEPTATEVSPDASQVPSDTHDNQLEPTNDAEAGDSAAPTGTVAGNDAFDGEEDGTVNPTLAEDQSQTTESTSSDSQSTEDSTDTSSADATLTSSTTSDTGSAEQSTSSSVKSTDPSADSLPTTEATDNGPVVWRDQDGNVVDNPGIVAATPTE